MSNCIPCHEIEGNKFLQPDNRDGVRILSATAVHISCTKNSAVVHISSTRKSTAAGHLRRADLVHKQFTLFCAHFQEGPALFSPPCHMYISASAFRSYKHYSTSFHSSLTCPTSWLFPKCWWFDLLQEGRLSCQCAACKGTGGSMVALSVKGTPGGRGSRTSWGLT